MSRVTASQKNTRNTCVGVQGSSCSHEITTYVQIFILNYAKMNYRDWKFKKKWQILFLFPRQVWFCLGLRAVPCPLLFCGGGLRMERCIGPLSNSCGPWRWRTPACSLDLQPPSSRPPRKRAVLLPSVSKREGKLILKKTQRLIKKHFVTWHWLVSP